MVYIGIDVGGTGIQIGVVDAQGKILAKGGIVTCTDIPFEDQIAAMAACAKDVLDKSGYTMDDVAAVGAGVPGLADPRTGDVIFCTNLGWHNVPFRREFQKHMDKPVYIDNDATVAGLAESVAGVSAGTHSSVFITLGTGVGGGIVIGGKTWSGFHGTGSELGHMIIEMDGEPCTCGNKGCLERYCSATAIIRMARELVAIHPESMIMELCGGDPAKINAKMVFDASREGDAIALKVFRRYVRYLGQAIANIANLLDPEVIVLGGGVSKAGDYLLNAVREEAPKYYLNKGVDYSRIEIARLGPDAGIIGAAMLGLV
ncbi:MAG: ROK family glucokinase [Clostridia bacterium]|nr:ROK family glucokinase [Clostridia bacterium]